MELRFKSHAYVVHFPDCKDGYLGSKITIFLGDMVKAMDFRF